MKSLFTFLLVCAGFAAQAFPNNFGYAEFFIQVNEPGAFTIRIDDQIITNASGKFRFFDLRPGVKEVYVQRNGVNFYRSIVSIYNGSRTVAEFRSAQGIIILQQVQLMRNNQMSQDFWYGYWNYNPGNGNWNNNGNNGNWNNNNNGGNWNNNNGNNGNWNNNNNNNNGNGNWNQPVGMDATTFAQFKETVRKQNSDSYRVPLIKNTAKTANFTSAQVGELLGLLSFDSYKLDAAKYCYDFVIDKNNYFKTFSQFQFDSYVKDLSDYISTRN